MLPPDEQPTQSVNENSRSMVPHGARENGLLPQSAEYDTSFYDEFSGQPQSPEILTNPFDAAWVWHSFRRRWILATGMGLLLGVGLAALAFMLTPKKFTAKSMIQVGSQRRHSVFEVHMGDANTDYELFQATQVQLIQSPVVLTSATRKQSVSSQPSMRILAQNEQIPWLSERLDVRFREGSEILQISITGDESADELRAYVKAVTDSYMHDVVLKERSVRVKTKESLIAANRSITQDIEELRKTYYTQIDEIGADGSNVAEVDRKLLMDRISGMMKQRADYVKQLSLVEMQYENDKQMARDRTLIAQSDQERMANDTYLLQLLNEQGLVNSELVQLRLGGSGARGGAAQRMQQKLASIKQMIGQREAELSAEYEQQRNLNPNAVLLMIKRTADTKRKYLNAQVASLDEEIETMSEDARRMGKQVAETDMLKEKLDQLGVVQQDIAVRLQQWEIEEGADGAARIQIVMHPTAEPNLGTLQRYAIVGVAGMFGFVGTCFGIAYLEFRARRLNGPNQVDEGLGIRVVGALPSLAFRGPSKKGSDPLLAVLMESVDNVRTALMHDASSRDYRIVMVTSASGHEGRTTVASQLAASLARAGRRTLLVDGDLRHPSLHGLFDVPLEGGLCEVLRAEIDVDDVVRPTHAEGLWVLSAGYCDVNAIQAMAREQLQPIFEKLREQYDFIIIDAPPVLNISDSLIMGQYVDGAVISVLRDYSKVPQIYQANERLRDMGIRVLGAVVNGIRAESNERTERLRLVAPVTTSTGGEAEVATPV